MSNPHQSPDAPVVPPAKNRPKKRGMMDVILGQKLLIYSILGYLCAIPIFIVASTFLGGTAEEPTVTPLFAVLMGLGFLVGLSAAIGASIGIFRMGAVLFLGSTRYMYAIGVLIPAPLVGLIVMFTANSKATTYLKDRGVTVGFFGAKR